MCVILVLPDLSAAFDTIDHDLLLGILERQIGVTGTALTWFRSYLSGRTQSVHVNSKSSANHLLKYGVPQGSVLGIILFTTYTQPLQIVQADTNFMLYADDDQLYLAFEPRSASSTNHAFSPLENCFSGVKAYCDTFSRPFGHLLVDLHPRNQHDQFHMRSCILPPGPT